MFQLSLLMPPALINADAVTKLLSDSYCAVNMKVLGCTTGGKINGRHREIKLCFCVLFLQGCN